MMEEEGRGKWGCKGWKGEGGGIKDGQTLFFSCKDLNQNTHKKGKIVYGGGGAGIKIKSYFFKNF